LKKELKKKFYHEDVDLEARAKVQLPSTQVRPYSRIYQRVPGMTS